MNRARIFLRAYAETGSVTRAARAARIHRSIHYRRLEQDPVYKTAFLACREMAIAVLEDEAIRRGVEGYDEPVIYRGQLAVQAKVDRHGRLVLDEKGKPIPEPLVIRKHSDQMLMFMLRGAKPDVYRERFSHDGRINHTHRFEGQLEDLLATFARLTRGEEEDEAPPDWTTRGEPPKT